MKIALLDSPDRDYTVQTVGRAPLGGTQTAVCHIARGLAKLGHTITLFRGATEDGKIDGVHHRASSTLTLDVLRPLQADAIVLISAAGLGRTIRSILSAPQRLVLWAHTPDDQDSFKDLHDPAERDAYDGFVFVSQWQAGQFEKVFGVDSSRAIVLHNAAGPDFLKLFTDSDPILAAKTRPPVLVYSSAPNRGLNILLQAFPEIRSQIPGARLQVFSSMKLYAAADAADQRDYGHLYDQCRRTEGVDYFGVVPQPQLANYLRQASVLAYPNTTEETSCIAAMEAMAAGCFIVTTAAGGLPETTAGFATLIPPEVGLPQYRRLFIDAVVAALRRDPASAEELLQRQRKYAVDHYDWSVRPAEWERWLVALPGRA